MHADLLPTTLPECRFTSDVVGEWLLAEVDGLEKMVVTTGMVSWSRLGEFVCKGKHWNVNYYKLLSYYNNGWYACVLTLRFVNNNSSDVSPFLRNAASLQSF